MAEQNRNKSYHRYVKYRGEKYTVTQLADKVGMNKDTLVYRLNANWSVEDAVNKPIKRKNCGCRMVEPQETETWNGYHGQITAPKGTFEKIYEDAESEG